MTRHYHPGHCTTCDQDLNGLPRHSCGACGREFCSSHIDRHMAIVHRGRKVAR